MSASKVKMREKKMRNQPASVQYSSGNKESGSQNGGRDQPFTGMTAAPLVYKSS